MKYLIRLHMEISQTLFTILIQAQRICRPCIYLFTLNQLNLNLKVVGFYLTNRGRKAF